jgi:hypothetical protein
MIGFHGFGKAIHRNANLSSMLFTYKSQFPPLGLPQLSLLLAFSRLLKKKAKLQEQSRIFVS